jgi:hypothetical protein
VRADELLTEFLEFEAVIVRQTRVLAVKIKVDKLSRIT